MARTAALLALLAAPLAAQDDARLERLDAATRTAVAAVIDTARAAGLPAEPLVQRALEGASKHAPAQRIVAAVRRLARDLGVARAALGGAASASELDAAAAALYVGARPADLAALRARRQRRSLVVPLGVLVDLVAGGVPADSATAAVLALAETTSDERYLAFRREVERDIALGARPAEATAIRIDRTASDVGTQSAGGGQGTQPPRRP